MKNKHINISNEKLYLAFLLFSCFVFYFIWCIWTPYNGAPDEYMRYKIVTFMTNHNYLPRGDTKSIIDKTWGFSYAYFPILPYMIGSLFQRIVSLFSTNQSVLLYTARMVSVLSGVGTVFWSYKISDSLFDNKVIKYCFPILVGFYPQLSFVNTYINTDSFAIMSTSMIIYFWINGLKTCWSMKSCIGLAIGIGLCAMSYYNCYGFILISIFVFFISAYKMKLKSNYVFKNTSIIVLIVFIICGWWFIRNAVLYNGDFLGRNAAALCQKKYAIKALQPQNHMTPQKMGWSLSYMLFDNKWLLNSLESLVAKFSWMSIGITNTQYNIFYSIFYFSMFSNVCVLLSNLKKKFHDIEYKKILFNFSMLLACIIPLILSIYYSYVSDYQPQGRYLLPGIIPLLYFVILGLKSFDSYVAKKLKIDSNRIFANITVLAASLFIILNALYDMIAILLPYYI